jgi:MarR family transcriptional regulator, transcriptional regulator for hemolysin
MSDIRDIWLHANHIIRTARQIINEQLRPLNLSSAEGNILLHLLTQGEEIRQEQLVEQLDVSKPAISRALDSLEAKGYVTRLPDPLDRRAHRVQLTGRARQIGPAVTQAYNQVYTIAAQGFSQDEVHAFLRLFSRVADNYSRAQAAQRKEEQDAD